MVFTPVLRDPTLPHQINFTHWNGDNAGLQVRVSCNCGWRSHRCIYNHQDAVAMYRKHLSSQCLYHDES